VNLGSERGYSVREILSMVEKVTRKKLNVPIGPRRPGDPDRLVAVAKKARDAWGWSPKIDLETIVASAWKWEMSQ
jgi:UDP-glucose 4-epimerase